MYYNVLNMVFRKRKTSAGAVPGEIVRKRRLPILLVVVGILILISLGIFIAARHFAKDSSDGAVYKTDTCKDMYGEISTALNERDYAKQKVVTEKIEATTGFENDQNCLYPVVDYYTSVGDINKSKAYFGKMETAYNANPGFSGDLSYGQKSIADFKIQIEYLEKQTEERKKGPIENDFKRH